MDTSIKTRENDDTMVREEVFADFSEAFDATILGCQTIHMGLNNRKWILSTDRGEVFIKCYHPRRYSLTDSKKRSQIEHSLSIQQQLHELADLSPKVWNKRPGEFVRLTKAGHYYVAMDRCEGITHPAGGISTQGMYRLGQATARMHKLMAETPAPEKGWKPPFSTIQRKQQEHLAAALAYDKPKERIIEAIRKQGLILSSLDQSLFDFMLPGWAHEDLWVDNILFHDDRNVKIIDFDTVQFSYSEIDIARVLLSGTLCAGKLRIDAIEAFLAGYREWNSFPKGHLPLTLKLLWCREAHWWLKGDVEFSSIPPQRFVEEMIWLTESWSILDECLGNL